MAIPLYVDTHCHLDSDIYKDNLDIVVNHALEEGVWIVTLGEDYASSQKAIAIAERYPKGVYAAVGFHPSLVGAQAADGDALIDIARFAELARHPKVVALGETGLDFSDLPRDARTAEQVKTNQKKIFGRFLDLARDLRLPLLLHCREAHADMLEMLETWDKATRGFDSRGIVHCFSGTMKDARRYFALDFAVSVTGIITHGAYQAEVIKKSPATHLVVESDCPYLTAAPWGIRRNEPAYISRVASAVAVMRGVTPQVVAHDTTRNALRIFSRIKG